MKYFVINDKIEETFEKFVLFYNEHSEEDCTITINTVGGQSFIMWTMIHMINQMPKVNMLIQSAYSAGFVIAYSTKCPKLLILASKGMHHRSAMAITVNENQKAIYLEDRCLLKNSANDKKISRRIAKKIMTAKEYKKYKDDVDIYFDFKRMKKIFPHAKIV